MVVQFVEMRFPDRCNGDKLLSTRHQRRLNGRRLQTIEML
jgi:hypothetical protein